MMLDFGTHFPPHLEAVATLVEYINNHDNAVHTVTIELDNGQWRVDVQWNDSELDNFHGSWLMDTNGGLDITMPGVPR